MEDLTTRGALSAFAATRPMRATLLLGGADLGARDFEHHLLEHYYRLLTEKVTGGDLLVSLTALSDLLQQADGDAFKLALIEDSRRETAARLSRNAPRAIWGVTPLINLIPMAAGNRLLGMETDTVCYTSYYITSQFDFALRDQSDWVIANAPQLYAAYNWMVFVWAMLRYDVFFYFNDRGLLPPGGYGSDRFGINVEEMQLLRAAGKRLYTLTYGADNRTREKTLASGTYNFCMHCPEPGKFCICNEAEADKVYSAIDQYATAMLASGLATDYVPNAYELHYLVIDVDAIRPAERQQAGGGPLRVLHAPNHGFFKGSDYLVAAVETLRGEGVAIELELISGKPNEEVLAGMARADVVADQFIGGAYGQTSIEAMAVGRPVLCYIKHSDRTVAPDELPIISCTPDTLVETLRDLAAMDREALRDIGEASRAYVARHHSIGAFAHRLAKLYADTAAFPATVKFLLGTDTVSTYALRRYNLNASQEVLAARSRARAAADAITAGLTGELLALRGAGARPASTVDVEALLRELYLTSQGVAVAPEASSKDIAAQAQAILNFIDARVTRLQQEGPGALQVLATRLSAEAAAHAQAILNFVDARVTRLQQEGPGALQVLASRLSAEAAAHAQATRNFVDARVTRLQQEGMVTSAHELRLANQEIAHLAELEAFEAKLTTEHDAWIEMHSEAMATQSAVFETERDTLLNAIDGATQERHRLQDAVTRQADMLLRQENRIATEQDRSRALEGAMAHIRASTSWRLTRPLRFASRTLGRMAGLVRRPMVLFRAARHKASRIVSGDGHTAAAKAPPDNVGRSRPPVWRALDRVMMRMTPRRRSFPVRFKLAVYPSRSVSSDAWLAEFQRLNGRPLRVLHIGNIANNAYNNAKIQRERGIAADAWSFDYYHIMACPEWEDANFSGKITDDMFPDWWKVNLRGFKRPRWFAQGPFDSSLRYLLAHAADAPAKSFLWRWMEFERWMLCHRSLTTRVIRRFVLMNTGRVIQYDAGPANGIVWKWIASLLERAAGRAQSRLPGLAARLRGAGGRLGRYGRTGDTGHIIIRNLNRTQDLREATRTRLAQLLGGAENVPSIDWFFNWWYHPYLRLLLSRYDIVQCYATYTALPFIVGRDYVAYEHGTIRAIPFQDTDDGKMCMATYRAADAVFVTNTDNLAAADKMRLARNKVTPLPHAFDSDKLLRFAAQHRGRPSTSTATFLTPTRQHWVDGDPGWAKGNDRVINALALVKASRRTGRLIAIDWGEDVTASKTLAERLGVSDMIEWRPKMKKRELWAAYLESHAVLDQFLSPALGGVTFEALMLGRRVITRVDEVEMAAFFGEPPPLYNCCDAEEIAAAMIRVIDDLPDTAGDGTRNQAWMERRHSADTIVRLQVERYASVLQDNPAAVAHSANA